MLRGMFFFQDTLPSSTDDDVVQIAVLENDSCVVTPWTA